MKEQAIKINTISLCLFGLTLLTMLYFSFSLERYFSHEDNTLVTAVVSYIAMFLIGITSLYRAFKDNEEPFQAMRYTFNYILNKVKKK